MKNPSAVACEKTGQCSFRERFVYSHVTQPLYGSCFKDSWLQLHRLNAAIFNTVPSDGELGKFCQFVGSALVSMIAFEAKKRHEVAPNVPNSRITFSAGLVNLGRGSPMREFRLLADGGDIEIISVVNVKQ